MLLLKVCSTKVINYFQFSSSVGTFLSPAVALYLANPHGDEPIIELSIQKNGRRRGQSAAWFLKWYHLVTNNLSVKLNSSTTDGLQIMGLLEARNLDFDTFYMVGVNEGVIPLDATALSILAFDGKPGEPAEELAFLKKTMAVGAGFDFSAGDLDGIWNEGTAQMALCCLKQGMNDEYHALLGYLKTQEYKDGGIPAADRDGVSTGFLLSGTQQLWEYNNTLSIGATGWYALAQLQADPLAH